MVIDFHTHIFPDKIAQAVVDTLASKSSNVPYTDGSALGMVKALDRSGADIAVTLPVLTKPTQFDSVLNFALEINKQYKNSHKRLISFAGMHPACENIREKMKLLKDSGILGVKIHPDYQETFIDDPGYIEILECAKDYDLIVVTHSGIDDGYKDKPVRCPPEKVLNVINKVGHSKFVLAHYGAHKQWEQVFDLLAGKYVYFDTAFSLHEISEELFKKILDKHGDEKVLFATDCPWRDIKEDLSILRSYNLNETIEQKILSDNALKLLNL